MAREDKLYKISFVESLIIFIAVFYTFSFTAIAILLIGLYAKNKSLFIAIPMLSFSYLFFFWNTFNFSQSRFKKLSYLNDYFNGRSMDVYIAKLRKYLKQDDQIQIINVHGRGFKLLL